MSFKKIEDIQYLYENLNSNEEELVELLEVLEDHLKESGYSDRAIECFIETADVHDVESHIQLSSLDEGAKLKLLKKLGTGAWNIIKKQGRKLKDTVKRNTPVKLRTGVKDTIKNTKDSVTKTGDKVKNAIKNNPKKSAIAGAGALTVGAFATGGDPKDNEDEKISKQVDDYVDKNKGDKPIRKIDPTPYNRQNKQEKSNTVTPEKKKNKPDGLARVIAGTADAITGNMTDFDQRGGKPQGLSRVMGGVTDFATQGLTDLDKRGGKPWGMGRVVAGAADKLTGDRTDFDKRGVSKLNKGQQKIYEPKKVETPKVDKPKDKDPLSWKNMKDSGLLDKPYVAPKPEVQTTPEPPKPTNPSGKVLPKPNEIKKGSNLERMINKNIEIHGAKNISNLRNQHAAWKASRKKDSGYSKDDFIKDFPNSNTAKDYRKSKGLKHPDLNKVLGRKESYDPTVQEQIGGMTKSATNPKPNVKGDEPASYIKYKNAPLTKSQKDAVKKHETKHSYHSHSDNDGYKPTKDLRYEEVDAFDIILSYLKETQQADSLDEALYVMTEMDAQTIQGIVGDFKKKNLAEEEADRVKDRRLEKYGIGHDGSDRNAGSSSSSSSGNRPKGKTVLQKETEKKYGKGKSAVDIVRAKIQAKHGSGAIAPSKTTQKATTKAQKSADQDGDGKVRTVDA